MPRKSPARPARVMTLSEARIAIIEAVARATLTEGAEARRHANEADELFKLYESALRATFAARLDALEAEVEGMEEMWSEPDSFGNEERCISRTDALAAIRRAKETL